jgi:hypothetical protein
MKRKKPISLIDKWKGSFLQGKDQAIEVEKLPQQDKQQSNGHTLALIQKQPVTFQLSRLENPKDFELMSFVIKAVLKTAGAPFKTVLHVERSRTGSRLVASDGARLHVAEISKKIKSGNYKPHVAKDTITLGDPIEGIKFPSWANVIPENADQCGVINLKESGLGRKQKETEKLSIAFHTLTKKTGEAVNVRFLEDLTKREWTICKQEGRRAIILRQKTEKAGDMKHKSPVAVIMPLEMAA